MRKMNAEPSNSRPLSPYHCPTRIHPTKPHPLIPVLYSPTTAPLASIQPSRTCPTSPASLYGNSPFYLQCRTHSPLLCPIPVKEPSHRNAPSHSLLPRGGAVVRWDRSGSPIQSNRCSHIVRAFVRRYRGKVYRVSEKSL